MSRMKPIASIVHAVLLFGSLCAAPWAAAQTMPGASMQNQMQISWEVRNRFRLFREERDFLLHTETLRNRSILGSEDALELQSDGRSEEHTSELQSHSDLVCRLLL